MYNPNYIRILNSLKQKIENLLFIAHPLIFIKDNLKKSSRFELYKKGKLLRKGESFHWQLPEYLLYVKDLIYTILWSFRFIDKCDHFIGSGNLNAFAGHILKGLNRASNVIYYVIDYIPKRFSNKFIYFSIFGKFFYFIQSIAGLYGEFTCLSSDQIF